MPYGDIDECMRRYRDIVVILFACLPCGALLAQTPLTQADLSKPTHISPYYFSPNAFPIPDMLTGEVSHTLRIELYGDYFLGFAKDRTEDFGFHVRIPLFTDRVNLTLWMPVTEYYQNTIERQRVQHLQDTMCIRGKEAGDVYVSTDIQVLRHRGWIPDATIRAAVKTASGGGYSKARYYDSPGYFFDATVGEVFPFRQTDFLKELRLAASAGFLCWQTDNGRQNDAVMYGAMVQWKTKYFGIQEVFSGYTGWENEHKNHLDAHDAPMSLKTSISGYYKGLECSFVYQYGLRDYPFHQFRIGVAYNIDISGLAKSRKQRKE